MSLYEDKGWGYLTSDSQDIGIYYDDDGSWGYRNEDGSGSYYGADGSWGYINSDGSSSYFEGDENEENEDESYDEEGEDDINATTVGNGIAALLGFVIGFGVPIYMAYKNAKHEEERKEAERRLEEERIQKEKRKIKQKKRKIRNKRLKALLFNKKNIQTDISADALVGNYVEYVTERIKEAGFTNYEAVPVKDIYEGSDKKIGEVEQVIINGQSRFDANTMFPYKSRIIISYHAKREIAFPISSGQGCKMTCDDLTKKLRKLGYTEIYTEGIADLVTGWIHKNGSIKYVLVNGKTKYKKGDLFNYDVKIEIAYHTFVKKM